MRTLILATVFFSFFFVNKSDAQKFNFHVSTGINVLRPQIRLSEATGLRAVYNQKFFPAGKSWQDFVDSSGLKNKYSRFDLNVGVRLTADDDGENPLFLELLGGISPYGTNWYSAIGTGVNIRWPLGPGYLRFQGGYSGGYDNGLKDGDPVSLCIRNKDLRHDVGAILEKENPGSLGSPWFHMVGARVGYDISIGDGFLGFGIQTNYDMQNKKYRNFGMRRNIPFSFLIEFSQPLFAM